MLKHSQTIQSPSDAMKKVQAVAWSPNSKKLAVANSDRVKFTFKSLSVTNTLGDCHL